MKRILLAGVAVGLAGWASAVGATRPGELEPPWRAWQVGQSWQLDVRLYSRAWLDDAFRPRSARQAPTPARPVARYPVHVRVAESEAVDGQECWRLEFTPGRGAPATIGGPHHVWVDRRDGAPRRLARGDLVLGRAVEEFQGRPVVTAAPEGFPVEFLPWAATPPVRSSWSTATFQLLRRTAGQATVLEGLLLRAERHELAVKQVWIEGEPFWREYERYVRGRKDLSAALVPGPAAHRSAPAGGRARAAPRVGCRTGLRRRQRRVLLRPDLPGPAGRRRLVAAGRLADLPLGQ
jgi:hypothetical protein